MKTKWNFIPSIYSHIFSDILISSLLLTVFIIIFEIIFYFVVINPVLESKVLSFMNNVNPYYINISKELLKIDEFKQLPTYEQSIIENTIKNEISNTSRQTINKIESNVKSNKKKLLAIFFGILSIYIIFVIIITILLRNKINWIQTIIFIIVTLILIASSEVYLYFFVYSQMNSTNNISLKNKIFTSLKEYLQKP
jgi:hypothetical protein